MSATYSAKAGVLSLCDKLEEELKRQGLWRDEGATRATSGAFGSPVQSFEEWLQGTFLVAIREAVELGEYPAHATGTAPAAARNLDGLPGAARIVELIRKIESAVERANRLGT